MLTRHADKQSDSAGRGCGGVLRQDFGSRRVQMVDLADSPRIEQVRRQQLRVVVTRQFDVE